MMPSYFTPRRPSRSTNFSASSTIQRMGLASNPDNDWFSRAQATDFFDASTCVTFAPAALKSIEQLEAIGMGDTPVCMAKTQYSFADDAAKLNVPKGFRITVRDVYPSAGAGFVVALAGDIMTMPGLSKAPAAERIRMHGDGTIEGLF